MGNNLESAMANGRAWYNEIKLLLAKLEAYQSKMDDWQDNADVEQQIQEGPLSIMVRDGWRQPGHSSAETEEYEILLSTGGPALRIYGKMGEYNEPETAELQAQDWFTPWVRVPDCSEKVLLAYARCFYFGEG